MELLLPLLREYAYDRRLMTISKSKLPLLAEVFHQGQCKLSRLISFHHAAAKDPRVKIQFLSTDKSLSDDEPTALAMVDVGQITTIWQVSDYFVHNTTWLQGWEEATRPHPFPSHPRWETSMNAMYHAHVGRARSSATGLAKKQLGERMLNIPEESRSRIEAVLRHLRKAGNGLSRMIDSRGAVPHLYERAIPRTDLALQRQAVAAFALAKDAELGGRFKRMSCALVAYQLPIQKPDFEVTDEVESISIINGGWLVLDQSVRAGAEARKLVERIERQPDGLGSSERTVADDRILHRLECLAMGEILRWSDNEPDDGATGDKQLEVDVQETLKTLGFPATAEGAKSALLKLGRWTEDPGQIRLNPWSKDVIDAARWYATRDKQRRMELFRLIQEKSSQSLEGREDLTKLPCVCIDAARTSFRDDAIGLRLRSSTGRPLIEGGSKWEILIHIADVSDIFSPLPTLLRGSKTPPVEDAHLKLLRKAAASRCMSRYDLPLGPLHLMPPVALETLSLETHQIEKKEQQVPGYSLAGINRCVTLWAYIDSENGKVLDIGIERTLISPPVALSFAEATKLLLSNAATSSNPSIRQASAIVQVANRILSLWNTQHQTLNKAAQEREERLGMREVVSREINQKSERDDGRDGFQRSAGHRLVDAALDLYGHSMGVLLRRAKAPIPRASGSGESRGGRIGTAPLRRYIDAIAQRQALSVLCSYGGPPLSRNECVEVNEIVTNARNNQVTLHSFKADSAPLLSRSRQRQALELLRTRLVGVNQPIQAVSTGRENEVAIVGVGAVAKCRGVDGSLAPGERIMVRVLALDSEKGSLAVTFVSYLEK